MTGLPHSLSLRERATRPVHSLTLVVDPRFSGGTCAAVAAEIAALAGAVDLNVVALETTMFKGRGVNPRLQAALDDAGIELVWNPPVLRADTVVFHNPSCLRFDTRLAMRISCRQALVVTHENFLRPGGAEGFDVAGCLALIDAALVCGSRRLAPVSPGNRRGVAAWLAAQGTGWRLADFDWFNICDDDPQPPNPAPRDRRGRHSRPGLEKFPPLEVMAAHFPAHAEYCGILGGDNLLLDAPLPRHWSVRRFGEIPVARFLAEIDFFVYFTHPLWSESYGRVIAEAIAAGKLVVTDPRTAENFGSAVVASDGNDVDAIVAQYLAAPDRYRRFVEAAQASLARTRPKAFVRHVLDALARSEAIDAVL